MFQVPPSELDKDKVAAWLSLPWEQRGWRARGRKAEGGAREISRPAEAMEGQNLLAAACHWPTTKQPSRFIVCVCHLVYGVAYEKVTAAITCVVLHIPS
jgi:hypothetical protein